MRPVSAAFWCVCLCAVATPAAAQQDARWEVEVYGGLLAGQTSSGGTRTLPPAGAPIVTSSPIVPSREVPSWFFGDGAALLNGVNADFGLAGRVVPLDAAFAPLDVPRTASFGARVRRRLAPHWSMEAGFDTTASASIGAEKVSAAVEATRASFQTAFSDLLASGPFAAVVVNATGATREGHRRETALTLALNRRFGGWGAFVPYATFGGGVAFGSGAQPSASLQGQYRFVVLGLVPLGGDDSVTVRYGAATAFVAVLGGGLQRDFSDRWGLRLDVRALIGPDTTRVKVDAAPASVRGGTEPGFVESFTNPAIQFSNDPSTGRVSSLSGAGLQGFDVFKGGTRARTQITIGVTRRF